MKTLEDHQEELSNGQAEINMGQKELTNRMERGQAEIIDKINHMTVFMTEGFKDFRKEMRTLSIRC
ncbi:hypothetical protein [Neobacillus drentensis]|uniref:hypothetical protein n=1 Tax=Neobacillus drentensis TaxID=220684 RepID=UPI002FFECE09